MDWPAADSPFVVRHIGYARGSMRIILEPAGDDDALLTLELEDVWKFFDRGAIQQPVTLHCVDGAGSFGWDLTDHEELREVRLDRTEGTGRNVFRAIAGRVKLRATDEPGDLNYPG